MPPAQPEQYAAYVIFTLAFLGLIWFLNRRTRPLGTSLILWGILTVVLSCGYGLIGAPALMLVTPSLSKIGFVLVLGGVAWSLLASCPSPPAPQEADHV
jgi:hypothetical protein